MAAISFPREFHHGLPLAGFSFPLEQMVEVTPLRSGKQIVADLGPSLWRPSFRSTEMDGEDAGAARAWYASLLSTGSFYAYDKLRQYPVSYTSGFAGLTVGGNPFTGYGTIASLAANKVELALSQLPVGFKLRPGDFLAFDYSSAAALTNTPRFQVDNLYSVAFPHRVVSSYTGYTIRARRGSDNAEKDFLPNAAGWLESAQLLAWSPGDTFYWVTAYDQSGSNRPWTQSTAGLQPKLITSGAYVYADASDTDRRLVLQNGSDFAQNISSFSYVAIATAESGISANAAVVKIAANVASASRSLIRYRVADNMWEFAGRRLDADSLVVAGSISTALGGLAPAGGDRDEGEREDIVVRKLQARSQFAAQRVESLVRRPVPVGDHQQHVAELRVREAGHLLDLEPHRRCVLEHDRHQVAERDHRRDAGGPRDPIRPPRDRRARSEHV